MHPLFVSYSRVDSLFALRLVRDLKQHGIPTWFDQLDIGPGLNWDEEIERALARADVVLVILSQHSVSSENVKNEIGHALELKKQVIPLLIGKCAVPLMITRLQREDFTGDYAEALKTLVLRLRGASRTAALEALSVEQVARLSAASAERLALAADAERAQVRRDPPPPVERSDEVPRASSESLNATQVSLHPPKPSSASPALNSSRRGPALAVMALLLSTLAIGSLAAVKLRAPDAPSGAGAATPPTTNPISGQRVSLEATPLNEAAKAPPSLLEQPSAKLEQPSAKATPAPSESAPPATAANFAGTWLSLEGDATVSQHGAEVIASRQNRPLARGTVDGTTIHLNFPDKPGCCTGHLVGQFIQWSNNQYWRNSRDPRLK